MQKICLFMIVLTPLLSLGTVFIEPIICKNVPRLIPGI
jgi:hypothetical protein